NANADFVGFLGNGIGGDAVEADGGKDERDDAKEAGKAGHGALLIEGKFNLLLHGPDAVNGEVGIQFRQDPGELRFEGARRHVGDELDSADKVRVQLDHLQQVIGIIHSLGQRDVEHGTRGPAKAPARKLGIAHDADDAEGAGILGDIKAKVLIERVFRALEKTLDESFVDDGHRRGGFIVCRGERAAAQYRHAKILEIVGAYAVPRGA